MKKVLKSKVVGATLLAAISPSVINSANAGTLTQQNGLDEMTFGYPTRFLNVGDNAISNKAILSVYKNLVGLSDKERAAAAKRIRTDFKGFMNENFKLNEGENYCLSNTWKTNEKCLKFVSDMANAVEKGTPMTSVDIDEPGLATIPYQKRQPAVIDAGMSTDTSTGTTTVHVSVHWSL